MAKPCVEAMCGIAGLWAPDGAGADDLKAIVAPMTDALVQRGPDGAGYWVDEEAGVALGHRRLSIVDLSSAGDQPMTSANGRYVITYNGEVYNAPDIARDLGDIALRGHSDTEIVLEAIARWGVEPALHRLAGMFALALWDREERALWLVRDRLGIKPLYHARQGGRVYFASELKSLMRAPGFRAEIDAGAVADVLRYAYVPSPGSILSGVAKLAPGHLLKLTADGGEHLHQWWSLEQAATAGPCFGGSLEDAADELESLLETVVGQHLMSDVPLGAFLSGGIDSSLVVAMMSKVARDPVHTFTIGFAESDYNEADDARAVAGHLGTTHTELILEPDAARAAVPDMVEIFDEPFADSSQVPTYLVSKLAREHVTVALSGDGGDEGFGGYNRYAGIERMWRFSRRFPPALMKTGGRALEMLSPAAWDRIGGLLPESRRPRLFGEKVHKAAGLLAQPSVEAMYDRVTAQWADPASIVGVPANDAGGVRSPPDLPDVVSRLRYWDMMGYLPDDILTKVDRASMAVGLEARVPLLDHRVIEFAWRLPTSLLFDHGAGKQPLRRVLARHVPPRLFERSKMGFAIPIGDWLRGPLRGWAEELLSERSLRDTGLVDPSAIRRAWDDHVSGRRNGQHPIWAVLMLQAWVRHWRLTL